MSKEQSRHEKVLQEYKTLRYPAVFIQSYDEEANQRYGEVVREMRSLLREPVGLALGRVKFEDDAKMWLGYAFEENSYYLLKHKRGGELFSQHKTETDFHVGILTDREKKATTVFLSAEPLRD